MDQSALLDPGPRARGAVPDRMEYRDGIALPIVQRRLEAGKFEGGRQNRRHHSPDARWHAWRFVHVGTTRERPANLLKRRTAIRGFAMIAAGYAHKLAVTTLLLIVGAGAWGQQNSSAR